MPVLVPVAAILDHAVVMIVMDWDSSGGGQLRVTGIALLAAESHALTETRSVVVGRRWAEALLPAMRFGKSEMNSDSEQEQDASDVSYATTSAIEARDSTHRRAMAHANAAFSSLHARPRSGEKL